MFVLLKRTFPNKFSDFFKVNRIFQLLNTSTMSYQHEVMVHKAFLKIKEVLSFNDSLAFFC